MREPEVETLARGYLISQGFEVSERPGLHGVDILAKKDGRVLAVEVKGDRPGHVSSPASINVDVMTLLGQIVLRLGDAVADDYAIAIRPVHRRLVTRALPALKRLGVRVFLVSESGVDDLPTP
jgi:hypothetical protein